MKLSWQDRVQSLMLPGLKRWILFILLGIGVIVFGVFLLLGFHPIDASGRFIREMLEHAAEVLPHRISGIMAISLGVLVIFIAVAKLILSIVAAYLPDDRESIPDVLYRKHHLQRGPKVVVIGGGTGLSTLLRGLKEYTNNITAIVTVGDDGGSSGRLRQELGVLPPGDIRNCITALADEDKLVTELFHYRFAQGHGLEGHSFGNLFLTAVYSITKGDMLEAARVASRVLNSCGQVLPSTLNSMTLVAEMADGQVIRGESQITEANGKIKKIYCEPAAPIATPQALEAIREADLLVLGPGSLYTSIIPNMMVKDLPQAIASSNAPKIYVCNVMTQKGETLNYTAADHVEALLRHAGFGTDPASATQLLNGVIINTELPVFDLKIQARPVDYDADRLRGFGIEPVASSLLGSEFPGHHDPEKLATALMFWFYKHRTKRQKPKQKPNENSSVAATL